jgi:hypothetical protein
LRLAFTDNDKTNDSLNKLPVKFSLKKIKVSICVNDKKIIPATLCLFDLSDNTLGLFVSECLLINDTIKVNFPHSLIVTGKLRDIRPIIQHVLKANGDKVYRAVIIIDNLLPNEKLFLSNLFS